MIAIPFPLFIAEIIVFWMAVDKWGFLHTLGLYLAPCFLGLLILNIVGRVAMISIQHSLTKGQSLDNKILHSGALFLAGVLLLIPAFFSRVLALVLILPGLRHLAVWKFKKFIAKKMEQGSSQAFNFGGPFGFGNGFGNGAGSSSGSAGFRYYEFRSQGGGFQDVNEFNQEANSEREVQEANILDVKPIEITHGDKKDQKD